MVSTYPPTDHSHIYSAQQAHQRPIFHTMNNANQPEIMSTPQQTINSQTLTVIFMFLVVNV